MIVAVRVRGRIDRSKPIEDTLRMLRLFKPNYASLLEDTPITQGMIKKVKDFITWGEVDEETKKLLIARTKKNFYPLMPPRKGYGRKGTKYHFKLGGGVGDRKEKINDLIKRMV